MTKCCLLPVLVLSVTLQAAPARHQESADGFGERLVVGTVVAVQPDRSLLTIRESDLWGHLRIRSNSYQVKQPFLLYGLRQGDRISAVFSTKDGMLYRVRRVRSYRALMPDSCCTLNCLYGLQPYLVRVRADQVNVIRPFWIACFLCSGNAFAQPADKEQSQSSSLEQPRLESQNSGSNAAPTRG